jgi:hypothetical protein
MDDVSNNSSPVSIKNMEKSNGHEDMSQLSDFYLIPQKYLPPMRL